MEEKSDVQLSEDAIQNRIADLAKEMKGADPAELENIKSIIRKNVRFFDRMTLAAYLLKQSMPTRPRSERPERRPRSERPQFSASDNAQKPQEAKERPERVIPDGAKTLYINIGKMKRLYAKDLSKLLQTELGITRDDIYQIRVHDKYSFVTMSEENCQKAIEKLNSQSINGRTAKVTYSEK